MLLKNDIECAVKKRMDRPVDQQHFPIPDPAILSISGQISDLSIGSVHPYLKCHDNAIRTAAANLPQSDGFGLGNSGVT